MGCCLWTAYELSLMPDIDLDDFRYGQLLGLAIALAFAVASYSLILLFVRGTSTGLFSGRAWQAFGASFA
jgi:hypothetical protein